MRGRFPSALPRTLTARNGQLTPQQQYVYDDFARIPRTAPKEGEPFQGFACERRSDAQLVLADHVYQSNGGMLRSCSMPACIQVAYHLATEAT